jgi:opacity protein-like surface antigen
MFFIRGGYQMLFLKDGEGGLSLGAGVKMQVPFSNMKIQFDYAYNDYGRLKGVHTVVLSVEY